MKKSPDAFRTISEVAEWLDVPTHVLRFWESRFAQVKPVKRAGGRRYYRPTDMQLIGGIKVLLHDEGMTIRGVQKLLRDEGIKHVAQFSQPLESEEAEPIEISARTLPEEAKGESDVIALLREADEAATPQQLSDHAPKEKEEVAGEEEAAAVLSFGSVREAAAERAPELPLDPPAARQAVPDAASPAPASPAPAAPAVLAPAIPETPEVPATDPADSSPAHVQSAGPVAKLIARNRTVSPPDGVRIEDVVAALRAVRDRSAS